MPNGQYILNDLKFNQEIRCMDDRALAEYTAKLAYSNAIRITSLENVNKKKMGIAGGIGSIIGAGIACLIDYLVRK